MKRAEVLRGLARALGLAVAVWVALHVVGCAALGPALTTARDVAKVGCAILQGTDGSSADVLASLAAMQRSIVEAQASDAAARGADKAAIAALLESTAKLAGAIAATSGQIVQAAGNGPARLQPCPIACAPSPVCVLDAPGQPPAPVGASCPGGTCDGAGKCCAGLP